jgi:hypothetical protein
MSGCPIDDIRSFARKYLVPAGRVSQTALLPVLRAPPSSDISQQEGTLNLFDRFVQVFEPLNRRSLSRGCLRGAAKHFLRRLVSLPWARPEDAHPLYDNICAKLVQHGTSEEFVADCITYFFPHLRRGGAEVSPSNPFRLRGRTTRRLLIFAHRTLSLRQVGKILLKHLLKQGDYEKARVVLQKDWMPSPMLPEEVGGILSELQVIREKLSRGINLS